MRLNLSNAACFNLCQETTEGSSTTKLLRKSRAVESKEMPQTGRMHPSVCNLLPSVDPTLQEDGKLAGIIGYANT